MTLLYPWLLFLFIPLYILYKSEKKDAQQTRNRQRKLLYLTLVFVIIALTRPVISNTMHNEKFDAQDYIIAIDASYSMQADDLQPSRYEVAKESVEKLLSALPKDRFTLFAFTSNAILISPPTTDTQISMMALDVLNPEYILTKGTSLTELLKTVAKTSYEQKRLIIFSDGGEEQDLDALISLAKKNHLIPYVVATASSSGALLKKDDVNLKDENNNLVISKINPILKEFAQKSGGKYYLLESSSTSKLVRDIISDLTSDTKKTNATSVEVLSFTELFWMPLLIALLLFFSAVTKLHQLYLVFLPFIFIPTSSHAYIFDFYHLKKADTFYEKNSYQNSAQEFEKITPSVESYYNLGVAQYQAKQYKKAIETFSKIKSKNKNIKQKLFYNMGNCAVKLKKFERAKIYYQKALALGFDKESYENLMLLYKLKLKEKKDVSNMLPKKSSDKSTQASKKSDQQKDETNSASSNSNQKAGESSNGSGSKNKKNGDENLKKSDKIDKSQYKIGYKAYELINEGYTNEKHPW